MYVIAHVDAACTPSRSRAQSGVLRRARVLHGHSSSLVGSRRERQVRPALVDSTLLPYYTVLFERYTQ
jgi:hypothetical protein